MIRTNLMYYHVHSLMTVEELRAKNPMMIFIESTEF